MRASLRMAMVCCLLAPAMTATAAEEFELSVKARELLTQTPGLRYHVDDGRIKSFYGKPITYGETAVDAAEAFRLQGVDAFGITPGELRPESLIADKRHTQQLMLDRDTGTFRFTAVYYTQYHGDIPVFRSDMRLLVRNEPGFPLVMAKSYLKPLGDFTTDGVVDDDAYDTAVTHAIQLHPDLVNGTFTAPEKVIWAGYTELVTEPRFGILFRGDDGSIPSSWLFIADAETGEVIFEESQIFDVDVTGTITGIATEGWAADICEDHSVMAMPYALVSIDGGNSTFADEFGNFVIPNPGTGNVTVRSEIRGEWFRVFSQQGAEEILTTNVAPPGPAHILHNPADTEIPRAQVDAYIHHNIVRDHLLGINPEYPVIANEDEFMVVVNKVGGICPNNAQYIASGPSTNFCLSSGGGPNMAWSVVVYHEYGHHVVQMGGSGQCEYGEGMSDVIGNLVTDESETGIGFLGNCNAPLRDSDNACQYSPSLCTTNCGFPCHNCGRLISGCVWSTRTYLKDAYPDDYRDIIGDLTLNSILLHTGSSITPQITIDFLMLDDTDGDLDNGSPHYQQICQGFNDHAMQCPELPIPIIELQPQDTSACEGGTASFRVQSSGATGYQWYLDDFPIVFATGPTYEVTNAQEADEADYHCVVSNDSGTVTTDSATLTVIQPVDCMDGEPCTLDSCSDGVCDNVFEGPTSDALGPRRMSVTPSALCSEQVAILLTSDAFPCLSIYVDVDGSLTPTPVFQDPATWSTLNLIGEEIIPGTTYRLQTETAGGTLSGEELVTTWSWGDVNNNTAVNFEDVLLLVNVFQGDTSNATEEATDLDPCFPNGIVNLADVQRGVQAFQLQTYEDTGCALPCSGD